MVAVRCLSQVGAFLLKAGEGIYIQSLIVVNAAGRVADRDDAGTGLGQEGGSDSAHVAEALDSNTGALQKDTVLAGDLLHDVKDAPTGGLHTPMGAPHTHGLARDHAGHRVAPVHAD